MATAKGKEEINRASKALAGAGYRRASGGAARRIIIALDGQEKCGKTHFALTAPAPIAVISTDVGLDGVVQKYQSDKEIWVAEFQVDMNELKGLGVETAAKEARKTLAGIKKAYRDVLGEAKTIIWDTATEVWEIMRMAEFGKLDQVKPHHYGPVNSAYRSMLRMSYDNDYTNLVLLHKVKDEYVNDKTTGHKKRSGFSDTGFLVQVNGNCWKDRDPGIGVPDRFHMTITDCRHNPEAEGMDLSGEDCSFPVLASLVFPETSPKDWR